MKLTQKEYTIQLADKNYSLLNDYPQKYVIDQSQQACVENQGSKCRRVSRCGGIIFSWKKYLIIFDIICYYFQKMKRKDNQFSLSRLLFRPNTKNTLDQKSPQLTVTVNLPNKNPLLLKVPSKCNMKILRSMLFFNLKKILTITQFNHLIGFQTEDGNYQLDYHLQKGLGQLQNNLFLNCLPKSQAKDRKSILYYKICKLISVGGFSKVYLLRDLQNGQFKAGKFIFKQNSTQDMIDNQYTLSSNITHPFILKTHNLIETENFFIFVLDFYPGGELFELLKLNRHMKEQKARFYIVEVLLALKYLHERSIAFRDIKPENILLDQYGHIKLVDFGLAKKINNKSFSFCGSLDYMAPEIIKDQGHSFEVDYYAVGNLLFQILVGSPPFYHPKFTSEQTKYHIINTEVKFPDYLKLTPEVKDLMIRLLAKEPTERLGFQGGIQEILAHEWFINIDLQEYMEKRVDPPIQIQIKMPVYNEQQVHNKRVWQTLLQKDIKQQLLKVSVQYKKTSKGNRHRSLNSQKSSDSKENLKEMPTLQNKSNGKLKTNMCLLYVLTHKRVTSDCPIPSQYKNALGSKNFKHLRSMNLSRKSSVLHLSHNKTKTGLDQPLAKEQVIKGNTKANLMLVCGGQNKENNKKNIKKRRNESQQFFKLKN